MAFLFFILVGLFILMSGYFSGSEIAVISVNRLKLRSQELEKKNKKKIGKLFSIINDANRTLSALLVGTNIAVVAATSITTMLFIRKYPHYGEYYATLLMSLLILIFGEILPKAIFRKIANKVLLKTLSFLSFFIDLFSPVVKSIMFIIRFFPGFKNFQKGQKEVFLTREDLKTIFHISVKQGLIDENNKEIFFSLFEYGSTYVREIMVPLVDIVLIENNLRVIDVIKISKKTGYSRIPVFEKKVYNIVGYINVLDLFEAKGSDSIIKHIRIPYYIPETKKIDDLFIEMNDAKLPIVFVVDEYGGVSGMATQEDIVEEIVGEIDQKPQEKEKEQIKLIKENVWKVSGDLNIDDINEHFNLSIQKKCFETAAGFVEYFLGKIPGNKESFIYNGYKFIVFESTPTCVEKVKIMKLEKRKKQN